MCMIKDRGFFSLHIVSLFIVEARTSRALSLDDLSFFPFLEDPPKYAFLLTAAQAFAPLIPWVKLQAGFFTPFFINFLCLVDFSIRFLDLANSLRT